ncbi:MAG: hypothetical protein AB1498_06570 [bacterium]
MKTIVWDVDDVLNDLMRCWFEQSWLLAHPECKLKYENLKENPPHKILGVSLKEYLASLDKFRISAKARKMRPVREVLDWFIKNGGSYRHMILTSRPLRTIPDLSNWVFYFFGPWIRGFYFVPSEREGENIVKYDRDKYDYLKWFGKADIFIDDSPDNIQSAEKLGIKVILMPRPWNKSRLTINKTLSLLK